MNRFSKLVSAGLQWYISFSFSTFIIVIGQRYVLSRRPVKPLPSAFAMLWRSHLETESLERSTRAIAGVRVHGNASFSRVQFFYVTLLLHVQVSTIGMSRLTNAQWIFITFLKYSRKILSYLNNLEIAEKSSWNCEVSPDGHREKQRITSWGWWVQTYG